MDFSSVCRLCLGDEHLTPIFVTISDSVQFSETIFHTTGIEVNILTIVSVVKCIHMAKSQYFM